MKKLLQKIFNKTFWKFILVGAANTAVGTGIMFLFYNVFHFSYWISSASNYVFGSILSYILNKTFTFQSSEKAARTIPRFVLNISVCYLVAYGLAKPMITALLSGYAKNVQENLAMILGMCFFVGLNYLGQRLFVFQDRNRKS